ncbi:hypothetical protein DL96DRAFT_1715896 [Flagelloscypha sp. PMI_526]|nr:hypothetical protein DL96DRAFT_1715896 [Flagelloscypha sp. PMI_526]
MALWRLTLYLTLFTVLSPVLSVKVDDLYGDENTGENKPNFVGDWGITTGIWGANGIECTNCATTFGGHPSEYGKPYKGTWHSSLNKDPVHTPYVELNFEGTSVTVYGFFYRKNEGQVKIVVDGKPFPNFVYDAPMDKVGFDFNIVVFEKKDLSPGSHKIVLSNLYASMFYFDYYEYSSDPAASSSSQGTPSQPQSGNTPAGNSGSTQSSSNQGNTGTGNTGSSNNASSADSSVLSNNSSITSSPGAPIATLASDSVKTNGSATVFLTGAAVIATTVSVPTQVATTSSSAAHSASVPAIVGGTIAGVIGLLLLLCCLLVFVRRRMALRRREEQAEAQAQAATPFTSERQRASIPFTLSTWGASSSRDMKGMSISSFESGGQVPPPLYSEA